MQYKLIILSLMNYYYGISYYHIYACMFMQVPPQEVLQLAVFFLNA